MTVLPNKLKKEDKEKKNKEKLITYKTTSKHFKIFKEEVYYWFKEFGLKGWELFLCHVHEEDGDYANAWGSQKGRLCEIALGKKWFDLKPSHYHLRRYAFHETCEIMFNRIEGYSTKKNKKEAREEVHNIIRILENVFFNPLYEKRFGRKVPV